MPVPWTNSIIMMLFICDLQRHYTLYMVLLQCETWTFHVSPVVSTQFVVSRIESVLVYVIIDNVVLFQQLSACRTVSWWMYGLHPNHTRKTQRSTYRSTASTRSTIGSTRSSLTLDWRKAVSQTTTNNMYIKVYSNSANNHRLNSPNVLPWHRWVQMGQEDQWDQSNPVREGSMDEETS